MEILVLADVYKPEGGGIGEHTHQLTKSLNKKGHNITVVAPSSKNSKEFDDNQDFRILRVPNNLILKQFSFFIATLFIGSKSDWVYCPSFFTGLIATQLNRIFKFKVATTVFGLEVVYPDSGKKNLLKPIQKYILRRSTVVITISSYTKNKIIDNLQIERGIEVIPPGINPTQYQSSEKSSIIEEHGLENDWILLSVARLVPRKGIDNVLNALPLVLEEHKNIKYIIVGQGDDRERLEEIAQNNNIGENTIFLGYQDEEEVIKLYNSSDIFVLPNRREGTSVEGFGIVFLEANAAGKPVIGGDHGGAKDAIIDGSTGFLVDPYSPEKIARSICELLEDEDKRQEFGVNGKRRAISEFDWDKISEQFEEVFTTY